TSSNVNSSSSFIYNISSPNFSCASFNVISFSKSSSNESTSTSSGTSKVNTSSFISGSNSNFVYSITEYLSSVSSIVFKTRQFSLSIHISCVPKIDFSPGFFSATICIVSRPAIFSSFLFSNVCVSSTFSSIFSNCSFEDKFNSESASNSVSITVFSVSSYMVIVVSSFKVITFSPSATTSSSDLFPLRHSLDFNSKVSSSSSIFMVISP